MYSPIRTLDPILVLCITNCVKHHEEEFEKACALTSNSNVHFKLSFEHDEN